MTNFPSEDGDDDEAATGESGTARAGNGNDSTSNAALDVDPGEAEIAGRIAGFLDELGRIRWDQDDPPLLERYRLNTCRAAELLRLHGRQVAEPFRIELRRARRLIDKLFVVCEADLPPEVP